MQRHRSGLFASIGAALLLTATACQPDTSADSLIVTNGDVRDGASQNPILQQALEVDGSPTTSLPQGTSVTSPTTASAPAVTAAELPTPTTDPLTSTSYGPDSGPVDASDGEVPGSALDYGPPAGAALTVVGVRYDDVLNFRVAPTPDSAVVASVSPLNIDVPILAVGQAWSAPSGIWWKVTVDGEDAWANQSYLAGQGHGDDFFYDVSEELQILRFETIADAAFAAAGVYASEEPQSRLVLSGEPTMLETGGQTTIDVLNIGDDSVKGYRLWVDVEFIFDETGEAVESVVLVGVYINPLCGRGVDEVGLCL